MKKIIYICIVAVSVTLMLFVVSCVKDPTTDDYQSNNLNAFLTVEEAQAFFEESFDSATRSGSSEMFDSGIFRTGNFTPQWTQAFSSENELGGSIGVPISPSYKYRSVRSEFRNGRARAYVVNISQQLLIVKGKSNDTKSQYLLTLIPDREYYAKNKGDISSKFLNSGDKGNFSGYAVYSTLSGVIVRMNRYIHGKKIWGISPYNGHDESEMMYLHGIIVEKLKEMNIQYQELAITTRVWVEIDNEFGDKEWIWVDYSCPTCGVEDLADCTCVVITAKEKCTHCKEELDNCTCFDICPGCFNFNIDCVCEDKCSYCGDLYCFELCQTCPYQCETPWCYGECKGEETDEYFEEDKKDDNTKQEGDNTVATPTAEQKKAAAPNAFKIFNLSSNISLAQCQLLEALINFISLDCFNYYITTILSDANIEIAISNESSSKNGSYSPSSNTLTLYNFYSSSNVTTFIHELFHAAQNKFYDGGIGQYAGKIGHANIEYEAYTFTAMYEMRHLGSVNTNIVDDTKLEKYNSDLSSVVTYGSYNIPLYYDNILYYNYLDSFIDSHSGSISVHNTDSNMVFNFIKNIDTNSDC